jgi:hypothetical protein
MAVDWQGAVFGLRRNVASQRGTPHANALRSCSSLLICRTALNACTIYATALNACTIYATARAQGDLWSRR